MPRLWDMLKREDKTKLRELMPTGWSPKRQRRNKISLECKLEDLEELTKLMKQGPGFYRD